MAQTELDSFVLKFKNLWRSERNASLSIKKSDVHLSVELGDAPSCD